MAASKNRKVFNPQWIERLRYDPKAAPPSGRMEIEDEACPGLLLRVPDGKRAPFAYAAVEAGDKQTVAAILHAPAYLSGLTDKQMDGLRHRAAYAFAPVESAQLEAVRNASTMVAAAGSRLMERFDRVRAMSSSAEGHTRAKIKTLSEIGQ